MIVRALRNSDPPGRFLKKDEKTGKWHELSDKKAAEKCSQALREKTQEERDRLKTEAGMPPSFFTNPALFQATSAMIKNGIPGLAGPPPVPATGPQPAAGGNTDAPATGGAAATVTPVPIEGKAAQVAATGKAKSDSSPGKKGKKSVEV